MSQIEEMNQLALQQENLGKQIAQILTNSKKDSQSRKTEAYISSRLSTVEKIMKNVQEIHAKIQTLDLPQHPYFESNYYAQIQRKYEDTKKYLQECPKATTSAVPEGSRGDDEQSMRLKRQTFRIQQLDQTIQVINQELLDNKPKARYEVLLSKLTKQWSFIQGLHEEILVHETSIESSYLTDNEYQGIEQQVDDAVQNLNTKMTTPSLDSEATRSNLKLPKITIPYFDGNYEQWPTFNDIFFKIVHADKSLSDSEKMQYLKTHVRGEPSRLIQHLYITDANYNAAWEILQNRYQNNRLIISKLIDKILDIPPIQGESANKLRQLHDVTTECLKALKNVGIDTTSWGPLVLRIITRKWDPETNRLYEQSLQTPHKVQDFKEMMDFLERRFHSLESITTAMKCYSSNVQDGQPTASSPKLCGYCNQQHATYACPKFRNLTIHERIQAAKNKHLCFNCLAHDGREKCHSPMRCRTCGRPHHTLLHKEIHSRPARGSAPPATTSRVATHTTMAIEQPRPQPVKQSASSRVERQDNTVLLATALIRINSVSGTPELLRVLIDPGSQSSFISERAAQVLGYPRQRIRAEITGLGEGQPKIATTKIQADIYPRFPSNFSINVNFLVLSKLTQTMPRYELENPDDQQRQSQILADPTYMRPGPIDAILGAEEYGKVVLQGLQKTEDGLLGQQTELGWILSGSIRQARHDDVRVVSMISRTDEDKQLTKFWDIEEVSVQRILSPDDTACEEHYGRTTKRNPNGTYTVRLPLKEDPSKLGDSRPQAIARLLQLEKKLSKDKELAEQYKEFMREYQSLGHMEEAVPSKDDDKKYYIPHHPVIKESSTTTKLRVVFDASCKTSTGISLNDLMHAGPRLQQELTDILLRWRKHRIALTADIEKMYRQIRLTTEDQKLHRILWRFDTSKPIQEFILKTVTYGTTAAPYLAIKTLQQLAIDHRDAFPKSSEIVMRDFYVDDLLSGTDTIEEAIQMQSELTALLEAGGFTLRKWSSNKPQILKEIPDELKDQSALEITEDKTKKSLGIHWAAYDDTLRFKADAVHQQTVTKRSILSQIAKQFDPLGWLTPVTIRAKLLIQELWLQDLEWDQPVPAGAAAKWTSFKDQLKSVEEIQLPRWIGYTKAIDLQLHGFCDSSEKAYGAVIYSLATNSLGETKTTLLVAKSKVAPARAKTTIPRLELCAAVLLAKLMKRTITALEIPAAQTFTWTDSMITLAWIQGDASRWKTFVANRVAEIHRLLPSQSWHHVPSEENPADLISRGTDPVIIKGHDLWWHGPKWLVDQSQWPKQVQTNQTKEEVKHCYQVTVQHNEGPITERFSSLSRMVRVLSYCKRFINHARNRKRQTGYVTVQELEATLQQLIKTTQNEELGRDVNMLKQTKHVDKSSSILNLNPWIDENGVMRVGGRLRHSSIPFEQRHPIILPTYSHLSRLIIQDAHYNTLHGGNQLTLAHTRRRFWIINGKKAVRSFISKCVICIRYREQAANQLMGDLPAPRVTPCPPFVHSGVDYAGPIQIRATKGRGYRSYKGYIAVFVCLSTKAIHLEVVSDMTTDAFMAAFRRFTARRGRCAHMYSDNGTNFVGASNLLSKEVHDITRSAEIQQPLATAGTEWHFIPPAAPHFGGLWEAGVKSMKYHLKRIVGDSTLTYEELTTLTHQIEACLNSRPLCPLNDDVNDVEALTPGHFLVGRGLVSPPNPIATNINTNLSSRWQLVQKMKKDFWHTWSADYLNRLQQRYKWKTRQENLKSGDLVILKEDNINPSRWPLARIVETHPSTDGMVRVVSIKRAEGNPLKRSIHKIIPLPMASTTDLPNVTNADDSITVTCTTVTNQPPPNRGTSLQLTALFLLLGTLLTTLPNPTLAGYTIQHPPPGLYVEHLGQARIERGTFRIEVKYAKAKFQEDIDAAANVTSQFEYLCHAATLRSDEPQCTALAHHLNEQQHHLLWIKNGMDRIMHNRSKRGLLGKLLTSVFGVNDEVYQDINSLEKNQQELIRASNHQTKFMLTALSTFNDTETRINNQLERFRTKINEGIRAANRLQRFQQDIDVNKMHIHLLTTYQLASNFISELCNYYTKFLNAHFNRGNLYDLISPAHIHNIIQSTNSKLPSNLEVIFPVLRMKVEDDETYIRIFGYLPIADVTEFDLMKITPTPLRVENGFYWILDIPNEFIAVDYNTQLYFQIATDEFKSRILTPDNKNLCSPAVVKNIETSPNCIIDEIYQRSDPTKCKPRKNNILTIIWKQLFMANTWMFIVSKPMQIAVTCNGVREDVLLNTTGIIQISQDCIIKTKMNILAPERVDSISVMASYARSIPVLENITLEHQVLEEVQEEPVFKSSDKLDDRLADLTMKEESLQKRLHETKWHAIHHSVITSSATTVTIAVMLIVLLGFGRLIMQRTRKPSPRTQNNQPAEMIELQPLN